MNLLTEQYDVRVDRTSTPKRIELRESAESTSKETEQSVLKLIRKMKTEGVKVEFATKDMGTVNLLFIVDPYKTNQLTIKRVPENSDKKALTEVAVIFATLDKKKKTATGTDKKFLNDYQSTMGSQGFINIGQTLFFEYLALEQKLDTVSGSISLTNTDSLIARIKTRSLRYPEMYFKVEVVRKKTTAGSQSVEYYEVTTYLNDFMTEDQIQKLVQTFN